MANTEVMGEYLFAGADKSNPPFSSTKDANGDYTDTVYNGSVKKFEQDISKSVTKGQGLTGLEIFDGLVDSSGNQVINSKGEAIIDGTSVYDKNGTRTILNKGDIVPSGSTYAAPPQFNNNDFSNGSEGWTVSNTPAQAGITSIAGYTMPNDSTYPSANKGSDSTGSMTYTTKFENGKAILSSSGGSESYGVVRGPFIESEESIELTAGATVTVNWAAEPGEDAYDVMGYVVNTDTGEAHIIMNETGNQRGGLGVDTTNSVTIPDEGNYKFVFVSGSYDLSGLTALGASLSIDDITVTGVKPQPLQPKILYELDQAIEAIDNNEIEANANGRSIGSTLDKVSSEVFEKLNIQHANLGNSNAIFERVFEQNEFKIHNLNKLMDETVGIDIAEASIKLQQLQLMFASIFSTLQEVNQIEQRLAEAT